MRALPLGPRRLTRSLLAAATFVSVGAGLLGLGCRDASGPLPARCPDGVTRCVLFVGSSLTFVNDLPGIVAALGDSAGLGPMLTDAVAYPDFSLEDHWALGDAQLAIESGRWQMVVLQQGPSALSESRVLLRDYTARFAGVIRAAGGVPALYMTWPAYEDSANFAASSESYRLAAADVHGVLFAVGDAWRATWRRDPGIALYAPDGLHPSPQASYLAALVIVGRISGRSTVGLPSRLQLPSGHTLEVDAGVAATLQAAADEVNAAARR